MTMHLVHPGLSNINTKNKKSKKLSAKEQQAKKDHEAWQRKNGVHPEQLAAKKVNIGSKKLKPYLSIDKTSMPVSNGFAPGGAQKSIFDSQWQRTYDDDPFMAEREQVALTQAEARKSRLAPIYNKGPVMVVTPGISPKDFGKRRP